MASIDLPMKIGTLRPQDPNPCEIAHHEIVYAQMVERHDVAASSALFAHFSIQLHPQSIIPTIETQAKMAIAHGGFDQHCRAQKHKETRAMIRTRKKSDRSAGGASRS